MLIILEAMMLASSCCVDAFAASFAYGSKGIRIPLLSNQIINLICGLILGLSLWLGSYISHYLSPKFTSVLCFVILFTLGIIKLLDSATKSLITRHNKTNSENLSKEIKFSALNFNFILNVYANPEIADVDENKVISSSEAAALAVSLALDGFAVGFGAGIGNMNIPAVILTSLAANTIAILFGCHLGEKLSRTLPFSLSWISGVILVILALTKLL